MLAQWSFSRSVLLCGALLFGAPWPSAVIAEPISDAQPPAYTGVWTPDRAANKKLMRAMQKQMRKRMAELGPKPGGAGGPGGGPPPGGMPPGGGGPGGGAPPPGGGMPPGGMGGPPMDADPLAQMSTVGIMRPEMDFAAPLEGNLRIAIDAKRVALGSADAQSVEIKFEGGARELGEGDVRAFASRENGNLVIEINTDDGVQVTHTYMLEGQGQRLRIKTHILSRTMPIPGGLDLERLYSRVDTAADAPTTHTQ